MDSKKDKSQDGVPTLSDEDIKTQPQMSRRLFFLKTSAATSSLLVASGCIVSSSDPIDFDVSDPQDNDPFDAADGDPPADPRDSD